MTLSLGNLNKDFHFVCWVIKRGAGAIIGDGDRKSWDARGPMIWDNFSIFRTNCAILTSYIRANPCTHMSWILAWMLSRCGIKC